MFKLLEQPLVIADRLTSQQDRNEFLQGVVTNPMRFICPNGAQEQYINTVANSTEKTKVPVILPTFANGVGKTTITINILLNIICKPQNGWFDYPIFYKWPFPKKAWYCSTAQAINDVVIPFIEDFCLKELHPQKGYAKDKQGRTFVSKMTFKNGWEISFKTFEQDSSTYESANVGLMIFDEPAPEPLWKASKSRRRMGCITLLPMTPLYCPPYILDEVKQAADENRAGYYHLKASVYEACMKRGKRGHLDPDIIDDMVAGYDSDEREARAFGEFMYYATQIYKLNKELHFINPENFPIPDYSKYLHVVDPHDSRPSAAIYAAKTPDSFDRYVIFKETPLESDRFYWDMRREQTEHEEIQMWHTIEKNHEIDVDVRILDRHFGWQTRGLRNFAQLYQDAGRAIKKDFTFLGSYAAPGGEAEIAYGHRRVRNLLKKQADGKPGLLIYDNCQHTWNGLMHYIRKRLTGKTAEDKLQQDAPLVEKYKDFPDVVRYLACSDLVSATIPEKPKTYSQILREKIKQNSKSGEFAS